MSESDQIATLNTKVHNIERELFNIRKENTISLTQYEGGMFITGLMTCVVFVLGVAVAKWCDH